MGHYHYIICARKKQYFINDLPVAQGIKSSNDISYPTKTTKLWF